jgi:tRNA threonylcarbamoyl adenosine modification protein YeaZ
LENEKELGFWQGNGNSLKSEDILQELLILLEKNTIEKSQIRQIVVSRGPGSFTGTRIGLAIAHGLKKSLDCDIGGVSVLEALALSANWNKTIIAAIPIGLKVCLQGFEIGQRKKANKVTVPFLVSFESFIQLLEDDLELRAVLYGKLYTDIVASIQTENQIIKRLLRWNENLAYLIGLTAKKLNASDNIEPIYIRDMR